MITAVIADWPVYLMAAVVWALCLLAVRLGWRIIAFERQNRRLEVEAEVLRRENLNAQRAADNPINFND